MSVARRAAARRAAARWPRRRAAAILSGHVARCMPWGPLVAGCGTGVCLTAALVRFAGPLQQPAAITTGVRAAFVPVLTGVAFLVHDPHRQLTGALPVRAWLTSAVRLAMALPVLAGTCWVQLQLAGVALAADLRANGLRPAALPWLALTAELAAGCAVALAAAALVARGRWQDLGGALAVPGAIAALAMLALVPLHLLPTVFTGMSGPQRHAWLAAGQRWAVLAAAAAVLACWASRDPWLRLRRWPARAAGATDHDPGVFGVTWPPNTPGS